MHDLITRLIKTCMCAWKRTYCERTFLHRRN